MSKIRQALISLPTTRGLFILSIHITFASLHNPPTQEDSNPFVGRPVN